MLVKHTNLIDLGEYVNTLSITDVVVIDSKPVRWWEVPDPVFLVQHGAPCVRNWTGAQPAIFKGQVKMFLKKIYPYLLKKGVNNE